MSKKKTKTRIEKQLTTHHFEHIAKYNVAVKDKTPTSTGTSQPRNRILSPQDALIAKDLRSTLIIIGVFVAAVTILGVIVYTTGILNPLLSHWDIKY